MKSNIKTLAVICSTMAFLFSTSVKAEKPNQSNGDFALVKDGISQCVIVLPESATQVMDFAAKELSSHLKQISGADVEVYKQKDSEDWPDKYAGVIQITDQPEAGESQLGSEEYKITTKAEKPWIIRIYGDNKRGALYGTYGFLQDVLGCRWFTPTISKIPEEKTISVADLNIQKKPLYEYREPFYGEATRSTEWIVRNRTNGSNGHVDDTYGGKVSYGPGAFVHTMFTLVPPNKYFESHPEYFALVDGKRVSNTQLCLTNPEVLKIATAQVKQWIADSPNADIFSVSQMDNEEGACQCEKCLEVLREEGAESGAILRFTNAIAAEIAKEHPNVKIETLAYNYSQAPPKQVVPLPNVRVRLCTPWFCRAHAPDAPCNQATFADVLAWSKVTHQLYIWDYDTEYNDFMMVHPSLNYLKSAFKVLSDNGAIGSFMLGSYNSPGGSLAEIKAYLCARLMWDSSADPDAILNEYIEGVYGKSAPMVKEWITLIHSPFKEGSDVKEIGIYDLPDASYLNIGIMDRSDELMEKARVASADDPATLEQIGKIQMWIDYTRIAQTKLTPKVEAGVYGYGLTDGQLDRVDRWLSALDHYGVERTGEGVLVDKSKYLSRETAHPDCLELENEKIRIVVLPGIGGKIVELTQKKNGTNFLVSPDSIFRVFHGGYVESVVKAEEEPGVPAADPGIKDVRFESEISKDAITLVGVSPEGRKITKAYTLKDDTLILKVTVENTTSEPLPAAISTHPLFPIDGFEGLAVSFQTLAGDKVKLGPEDFSINWNRMFKKYTGNEIPKGEVLLKRKDSTIRISFDPEVVETFQVWNQGGTPKEMSLNFFCKPVELAAGESTSFEQVWKMK